MMKKIEHFLLISMMLGVVACTENKPKVKSLDLADLDTTVSPAADFDNYANGGWKKRFPIPDEKSRFGSFDLLADSGEIQVQSLIAEIANAQQQPGSVGAKIADFYNTGMDTAKVEALGLEPIKPILDQISNIGSKQDLVNVIADFQVKLISPVYQVFSSADEKNSEKVVAYLYQGGLGLPDRDYYMNEDQRSREIQEAYKIHLQKVFVLGGEDENAAKTNSEVVYKFEKRLAAASMTKLDLRNPQKTYNKMNPEGLQKLAPEINWADHFELMGIKNPGDMIVCQPLFFAEFGKMVNEVPIGEWKAYLKWQTLRSLSAYLPKVFVDQSFDFYGKTLSGQMQQRPRWKRVQGATDNALSEAIGQMYVQKYFPAEAKTRMLNLVENLRVSLGERIKQLSWMGDTTKTRAQEKLNAISVKIGYPDKWRDYSDLNVSTESYVANILTARKFDFDFMVSKINKPVDRTEWHMAPQEVNAYYNPVMNEIVFPAAILQPPFFYLNGDDAVNYGAIGVVIGHEMTHGFDDQGRQYDQVGNLADWWTAEDSKLFEERSKVLVDQFNGFTVLDTIKANGELSLGENIADLGGLNIAYNALQGVLTGKEEPIDGFTPEQRFFLSYAHLWAQNIRDKEIIRLTNTDVHSLGRLRVIGPLRNMPEFHKAFNVKEGDYMYLPEPQRAAIW